MNEIDPKKSAVVDLRSYDEIRDAVAVDVDRAEVRIKMPTFDGDTFEVRHYPYGVRLIKRR